MEKLPDPLAEICSLWPEDAPLKWMFQDEARFGRVNDGRRCWAPKPIRPLCSAMRTREYTYAYAAVDGWTDNLRLLPLPPYAPELNPVEHVWDELREQCFHNLVFDRLNALENHLEEALRKFEQDHSRIHSIVAWPWIIHSLLN